MASDFQYRAKRSSLDRISHGRSAPKRAATDERSSRRCGHDGRARRIMHGSSSRSMTFLSLLLLSVEHKSRKTKQDATELFGDHSSSSRLWMKKTARAIRYDQSKPPWTDGSVVVVGEKICEKTSQLSVWIFRP